MLNHLKEVFETKGGVGISEAGSLLEAVITEEDNVMLKAPPTKEEVQQAVFQIGANKAPGPDGFSSIFFHSFWHAIGDDIFLIHFLSTASFLPSINHTNIVLIPKHQKAEKP